MLAACAHAGPTRPQISAPDPVIKTVVVREVYCPVELWRDAGGEPVPKDGAIITHNAEGGEYLDGLTGWGQQLLALITGTRQACTDKGAAPQ